MSSRSNWLNTLISSLEVDGICLMSFEVQKDFGRCFVTNESRQERKGAGTV